MQQAANAMLPPCRLAEPLSAWLGAGGATQLDAEERPAPDGRDAARISRGGRARRSICGAAPCATRAARSHHRRGSYGEIPWRGVAPPALWPVPVSSRPVRAGAPEHMPGSGRPDPALSRPEALAHLASAAAAGPSAPHQPNPPNPIMRGARVPGCQPRVTSPGDRWRDSARLVDGIPSQAAAVPPCRVSGALLLRSSAWP
ncbi:hypothetical protein C2845_PM09G04540 [Panicum miliaceum]|uniref:Uncharacterized protein n=1 Tax=Panicum miliaceum TaxID=4540 RepID=A0A3L6RYZ3_PANMI|nr:hypothetical protein C2845_PM09G04540 [Panicum miliaceum]